jgi:hypothetical protein
MNRDFAAAVVLTAAAFIYTSCASTASIVDSATGAAEYHVGRYNRLCDGGNATTPECMAYGIAINNLVDVIDDVENNTDSSLTGSLPSQAKKDLDEALHAVAVTSGKVK